MKFVVTLIVSFILAMMVSSCQSTLEKYFELETPQGVEGVSIDE